MRLAAPVTNIDPGVFHQTTGSPCTSISSGSIPARAGSGNRPVQLAHSQKNAVLELSTPDTTPIMRGLQVSDATPAPAIETIIVDHGHGFHGRKHAAAKFVRHVPQQLRHIEHRADRDGRARDREKQQRHLEIAHLAEDDVRAAVDDVADADGALVIAKRNPLAEPVRERSADQQSDAGRSPQIADACRPAIETPVRRTG